MIKFAIKNRWTGAVQFEAEIDCAESEPTSWKMRLAVLWAIAFRSDLRAANLSAANLSAANLSAANLSAANLSAANLRAANLRAANLSAANLSAANLRAADLSEADLSEANLSAANLREADLREADLSEANLSAANLSAAKNVPDHLSAAKADIFDVLDKHPAEAGAVLVALEIGKVEGKSYGNKQECGCLLGTIAKARNCTEDDLCRAPDVSTPAESFFLSIRPGHKPGNSVHAALAHAWITEWMASHKSKPAKASAKPKKKAAKK